MANTYERDDGPTVIELLVVVAIIVILIAILVPVFGKAKERSVADSVMYEIGLKRYRQGYNRNVPDMRDIALEYLRQAEKGPLVLGDVTLCPYPYVDDENGIRWRMIADENGKGVADTMIRLKRDYDGFRDLLIELYRYHRGDKRELLTKLGLGQASKYPVARP